MIIKANRKISKLKRGGIAIRIPAFLMENVSDKWNNVTHVEIILSENRKEISIKPVENGEAQD